MKVRKFQEKAPSVKMDHISRDSLQDIFITFLYCIKLLTIKFPTNVYFLVKFVSKRVSNRTVNI